MSIGGVISAIVIGLVLGLLGKLLAPGRQNIPIWLTILVGIAAAFVGTWIARLLGVEDTRGIDWIEVVIQLVLAAVGVSVVAGVYGRRSVR
ncbi:GlsB/YeaQ/YmgE family stress response membrane protein [Lentzea sp. DG1S-22]|uniref:GlsB/YeaQ/YmgE family stress response membrane protein n=1 Tax=Lentzea sp. DG1S-22 TaxID=3108822 RepID=UPI002E798DA4|nr:GlsB/YeaQ/YmgE family stress response membrane protein [Lentzea sp. DG1S-22]WVH84417.1 GlsB/YeaQ/YmgE family stress response membrane protein [Lentzea sp. DG1S-22]